MWLTPCAEQKDWHQICSFRKDFKKVGNSWTSFNCLKCWL